jgi:pimeloyl-ACP methyl ester carboxylesterase
MDLCMSPKYLHAWSTDAVKAVDWVVAHLAGKAQLAVVGGSLGGAFALGSLLNDARVARIVATSAPHDYWDVLENNFRFGPPANRLVYRFLWKKIQGQGFTWEELLAAGRAVSPVSFIEQGRNYSNKVHLAHARDDSVVPFATQFEANVRALGLPPPNTLLFSSGGHTFGPAAVPLVAQVVSWLTRTHE